MFGSTPVGMKRCPFCERSRFRFFFLKNWLYAAEPTQSLSRPRALGTHSRPRPASLRKHVRATETEQQCDESACTRARARAIRSHTCSQCCARSVHALPPTAARVPRAAWCVQGAPQLTLRVLAASGPYLRSRSSPELGFCIHTLTSARRRV